MKQRMLLLTIGLALVAMAACSPRSAATQTPTGQDPMVDTIFSPFVRTTGIVVPAEEIALSFPISGRIAEMFVEQGDVVQAGDLIARLDTTVLDTEVSTAEGRLAVAEAQLAKVMAGATAQEIAEAESALASAGIGLSTLIPAEAAARTAAIAAAQARLDYLRSLPLPEDLAIAQASVTEARSSLEAAVARRSEAQLAAPFDGTVSRIYIREFEQAPAGAPVVRFADLSRLRVESQKFQEADLALISIGDRASLTFDALPGVSVEGTVSSISQELDGPDGVTFIVTIDLTEVPEGLLWGMTANIDIPLSRPGQ